MPDKKQEWHALEADEVCKTLGTNPEHGLSDQEVTQKRKEYGDNKLPEPKRTSHLQIFLNQLLDFMVLILLAASVLSGVFGDLKSAIVLGIVVIVNITIGFSQEAKAEHTLSDLLSSRVEAQEANVTRNGHVMSVKAPELVVGDLVNLEEGDQVPADVRLVQTSHLQIDESTLTGESAPVDKVPEKLESNIALADRTNMAFMMTMVVRGRGLGVVVRTGIKTEVGKSSKLLEQGTSIKKTDLQRKLSVLGKWLVVISVVLCGIITGLGLLRGHSTMTMIKTGISLAVSVIPEGLVAVTTVTMALGVQRMAKHKAIVRHLPAVEVLGAVSVICTDKTGTLTEGKMKVEEAWVNGEQYYFSGAGLAPEGALCSDAEYKKKLDKIPEALERVLLVCSLCNNASIYKEGEQPAGGSNGKGKEKVLEKDSQGKVKENKSNGKEKDQSLQPLLSEDPERSPSPQNQRRDSEQSRRNSASQNPRKNSAAILIDNPDQSRRNSASQNGSRRNSVQKRKKSVSFDVGEWKTVGTPTEISLEVAAMKANMGKETLLKNGWSFVCDIPFDSERKRMSVVYKSPKGSDIAFCKGAAEHLLPQCVTWVNNNDNPDSPAKMSQEEKDKIMQEVMRMSETGMRVLALASHKWESSGGEDAIEHDLCFLGLVGIIDPPRSEVGPSIEELHEAGIQVVMITGDNPVTAKAIANKLEIFDDGEDGAIKTGPEIDDMDDEALKSLNPFPSVFARVSPEAKLRIVQALQGRHNIVAFIGDGVNDAASIKNSDVGVAMGITGTDVSQQSADIILADDNFSHILMAVEEGRRTFDNIFKFTMYLLSCNSAEIFVMLIATIFNITMPFTSIQILFANIIADVPPSLSLGIEPVEEDTMSKPPRDSTKAFFGWLPALVVVSQGMSMSVICIVFFVIALNLEHYTVQHAQCLVFTMLVLIQLFHAFLSRSFTKSIFTTGILGNRWLIWAVIFSTGCLVLATYIPGLNTTLDMVPLSWLDWAKVGAAVTIHSIVVEGIKFPLRYKARSDQHQYERLSRVEV